MVGKTNSGSILGKNILEIETLEICPKIHWSIYAILRKLGNALLGVGENSALRAALQFRQLIVYFYEYIYITIICYLQIGSYIFNICVFSHVSYPTFLNLPFSISSLFVFPFLRFCFYAT